MVLKAAAYLVRHGPVTQQERWEEASGYSPSTLASNIAALIGAACFARGRGDEAVAALLEEYADFLECHIKAWTVTTEGSLAAGIQRHYIRILPEDVGNANPLEDPNSKVLKIKNHPAGAQDSFPAKEIVDAGFLQLVRYGIRRPDDPSIADSFRGIHGGLTGQVWAEPDRPEAYMFLGRPTGSAMPLMWAHGEYIKLLRSVSDGRVFDL